MKKKINLDRDPISREEIASRMNFDQLLSNFPGYINPPFYKSGWFITTVASVAVLVTITTTLLLSKNNEVTQSKEGLISSAPPIEKHETIVYSEDTPCVNPPVKELDIKPNSYTFINEKGGEFKHISGSVIKIPKNAFVDKNGNPLNGEIEIRYREFHDAIDFLFSGIPMTYDSAGTEYTFESAGMIEIYGFQNGQPVEIANNKSIRIEMLPKDGSSRFNLYELDTTNGIWTYKGKPELIEERIDESTGESDNTNVIIEVEDTWNDNNPAIEIAKKEVETTEVELININKEISALKKAEPIQPKTSVNKDRQFDLDINPNEFPELKNYSSLTFEVDKNDNNFSTDVYAIEWEDISLSEKEKGKSYYLTLFKTGSKKTFTVHPVFEGANYKKAMAEFDAKFKVYNNELNKRKAEEEEIKEKLKKQMALYEKSLAEEEKRRAAFEAQQANNLAQFKEAQKNTTGIKIVARAFNVTQFGTWNCDSPIARPSGRKVEASFAYNGENLGLHNVNLIEKNKNAIFTYHESQYNGFKFNPQEENTIIGFTNNNEIAIIRHTYFMDMSKENKHQFEMEIINIKTMTAKSIKETINI